MQLSDEEIGGSEKHLLDAFLSRARSLQSANKQDGVHRKDGEGCLWGAGALSASE